MTNKMTANNPLPHIQYLKTELERLDCPSNPLKKAISYALFSGGKGIRPRLIYATAKLLEVDERIATCMAAAVELVHAYSLIHDDLPAMDNDDFRRGQPTCHKAFDEATAILAGDAMQPFAFEILLKGLPSYLNQDKVIDITLTLLNACGAEGMVGGQMLDINTNEIETLDESHLCQIHHLKTGKLFSACIGMVIKAASPPKEQTLALLSFANQLGLLFQIHDDYLDRYGASGHGKSRLSDLENGKKTFADLYKKEPLKNKINALYQALFDLIDPYQEKASDLIGILKTLQNRR